MKLTDAREYFEIVTQPAVYGPAGIIPPDTLQAAARMLIRDGETTFAVERRHGTGVIGSIRLMETVGADGGPDNGVLELGYILNPQFWHQGYMRAALVQVLNRTFDGTVLAVCASVYVDNVASRGLLRGLGFEQMVLVRPAAAFLKTEQTTILEYRLTEAAWVAHQGRSL